ncbi:MAG TPA: GlyGly-CTERM sorting domain-containing protein [Opitutaceae bacterium]|jgi:tellurite resistance protein TehA-like permease|nr:GlyGly-CTERM sorting domain-containing protein [Opitutaceae bacterium]
MNFDLRLPLGMIFTLFGAMLVIYGLAAHGGGGPTSNFDLNAVWGAVVLAFGLWMLVLAMLAARRRRKRAP